MAETPQIRAGSVKKDLVFGTLSNTSGVHSQSSSETLKPTTLPNEVTHLNSLNTSLSDEQKLQQVGMSTFRLSHECDNILYVAVLRGS